MVITKPAGMKSAEAKNRRYMTVYLILTSQEFSFHGARKKDLFHIPYLRTAESHVFEGVDKDLELEFSSFRW